MTFKFAHNFQDPTPIPVTIPHLRRQSASHLSIVLGGEQFGTPDSQSQQSLGPIAEATARGRPKGQTRRGRGA